MVSKIFPFSCLIALLLFATACKDDEGSTSGVDFNEREMLENYGKNVIYPAYASFEQKAQVLQTRVDAFADAPSEANLTEAQNALKETWISWQGISLFEFGPAADLGLSMSINNFPTRYPKIDNAVQSGTWDINGLYAGDMRGMPALDYLLFSESGDNAEVLSRYTSSEQADNRKRFAKEVAAHLHTQATAVRTAWAPESGNYLGSFITNTGNSASSALSLLVNNFVQGFEVIKNQKIRTPLGLLSQDGQPIPRAVEAYYSSYSLPLIQANLESVTRVFNGTYASGDGPGLADYLKAHHAAGNTEEDLAAAINAQLQSINSAVDAISGPLRQAVTAQPQVVEAAYMEMANIMALLKADMPSALSVQITYIDNDGD
ncbi:Imelysin [Flammeovirgaceae bacterium 311]|nr:Imelysin [Flammeovirgaceae bacterium 311]